MVIQSTGKRFSGFHSSDCLGNWTPFGEWEIFTDER